MNDIYETERNEHEIEPEQRDHDALERGRIVSGARKGRSGGQHVGCVLIVCCWMIVL